MCLILMVPNRRPYMILKHLLFIDAHEFAFRLFSRPI